MPVSVPVLSAVDKVVVGRPFKVLCESKNGTLPITYTLLKGHTPVDNRVFNGTERAIFSITSISFPKEIDSFTCQAYNRGPRFSRTSDALTAPVIGERKKILLHHLPNAGIFNSLEMHVAVAT